MRLIKRALKQMKRTSYVAAICAISFTVLACHLERQRSDTERVAAEQRDSETDRLAAAERYYRVVSFEDMWDNMAQEMAKQMPPPQQQQFADLMHRTFRPERIRIPMLALMATHLTTRELNALAEFYGSPEGQSVSKKMGAFMADAVPIVEVELQRASNEVLSVPNH
jgi:hypothetical protein